MREQLTQINEIFQIRCEPSKKFLSRVVLWKKRREREMTKKVASSSERAGAPNSAFRSAELGGTRACRRRRSGHVSRAVQSRSHRSQWTPCGLAFHGLQKPCARSQAESRPRLRVSGGRRHGESGQWTREPGRTSAGARQNRKRAPGRTEQRQDVILKFGRISKGTPQ